MRILRLIVSGLVMVTLVAACSSQKPSAADLTQSAGNLTRISGAALTRSAVRTQTALDAANEYESTARALDVEARADDDYYNYQKTQAAQQDADFERQAGEERQQRNEAIRDCIIAGNNDTLCQMDPYNP